MLKREMVSNTGVHIGANSGTLLNLLLGANDKTGMKEEYNKIQYLIKNERQIDIITDLSLYNKKGSKRLWEMIVSDTPYMAGTVPIYLAVDKKGCVGKNLLYESICEQCEKGVSIITIHPTATARLYELSNSRLIKCTSRGGSIVLKDLLMYSRYENVYMQILDKIIEKCREHNVILSIGSTFRSATIMDAMDNVYREELEAQIKIADYIKSNRGEVIIETPGHADPQNIFLICDILKQTPFSIMPLGPMPTDIACEEDDTAAVIGATLMGTHDCADILSIVTRKEHLSGIPDIDDIDSAIRKYEVAKHIIDLYKVQAKEEDYEISWSRANFNSCDVFSQENCSRCGKFCPLRNVL